MHRSTPTGAIMHKKRFGVGLAVCLVFLAVSVALAGVPGEKFAQETASGEYAIANAAGNVDHPKAIYVRVKSRPHQRASGAWSVVCAKGFGAGSKSGQISGTTPFVRKLRLNYRNPTSCTASANAQLAEGGFVKVQLYATH